MSAKPGDGAAILQIATAAYRDDLLSQAGLPNPMTAEQQAQYDLWRLAYHHSGMRKCNRFFFKAVDDKTAEIVGYAVWNGPEPGEAREREEATVPEIPPMPDFISSEVFDEIGRSLEEASDRATQKRRDVWNLVSIVVMPDRQGQGIGQRLIEAGLYLVDKDRMDCFLASTPVAMKLYGRNGFAEIEKVPLLDGNYTITIMSRRSRSQAKADTE